MATTTNSTTTTHYPDDFKCPISLEIMSEPVILSSGHTFDRPSIQRWLDAGHRTCPITKLPLSDSPSLIPNHALRSLISTYTNSTADSAAVTLSKFNHIQERPETLISNLTSKSSSPEAKLAAIEHLCRLSKRDFELRKRLTESGAVAALIGCFSMGNFVALQEKSLKLVLNLSLDDDNKVGLVAEGAIGGVVAVLRGGESAECRATAATVLTSLAVVEVNKATIGAYPFAIRGLVALLGDRGGGRGRKEAATTLYALCSFPDNRRRAVECGAVEILMNALDSGLERAVEVLGLLAKCKRGREEMVRFNGCVKILVHVVRNGSSRGVQYALLTLNSLCLSSEVICMEALKEGVFELCLRFLEDDNEKVRRNASNLIKVFGGAGCI